MFFKECKYQFLYSGVTFKRLKKRTMFYFKKVSEEGELGNKNRDLQIIRIIHRKEH